ncbi:MAG: FimV/HubP family polar landmark protein [Gammaproteobacteria bacterium]
MRKYGLMAVLVIVVALLPGVALPLGLGQIQSETRIGEPLVARIPIVAANAGDLQGLAVGLADPSAYQQAGLSEPDFLFDLKFKVEQGSGGPYVLVTSSKPVNLPFLNLLVHISWTNGQLTRQYTVLLNPPVIGSGGQGTGSGTNSVASASMNAGAVTYSSTASTASPSSVAQGQTPAETAALAPGPTVQAAATPAPSASSSPEPTMQAAATPAPSASSSPESTVQAAATPVPSASSSSQPAMLGETSSEIASSQPAQSPVQAEENPVSRPHSYGPVPYGATLWSIAYSQRPDTGVSIKQMMIALYRANPHAFSGSIYRLLAGTTLRIPSRSKIGEVSRAEAVSEVADQAREWQSSRGTVAGNGNGSPNAKAAVAAAPAESQVEAVSTNQAATGEAGETASAAPATATGRVAAVGAANAVTGAGIAAAAGSTAAVASAMGVGRQATHALAAINASSGGAATAQSNVATAAGSNMAVASAALAGHKATKAFAAGANTAGLAAVQGNNQPTSPTGGGHTTGGAHSGNAGNAANSVNSVYSAPAQQEAENTVMDWLTSPKGWVVIGLIVLLLLILLIYFTRRRAATSIRAEASAPADVSLVKADTENLPYVAAESSASADQAMPAAAQASAEPGEVALETAPTATVAEPDEPEVSAEIDEPMLEPGVVEQAAANDRDNVIGNVRAALEREPNRRDLRSKLLELLFMAGDAEDFRAEALRLHGQTDAEDPDWQAVSAMGRQLMPGDELFSRTSTPEWNKFAAQAGVDPWREEAGDLKAFADRPNESQPTPVHEDGFDSVSDEFSTFVETYVPLGQGGEAVRPQFVAHAEPEGTARLELESELSRLHAAWEEEASYDSGPGDRAGAKLRLDLARAYLKLGYPDSAREVLEEVLGEGIAA